MTITVLAVLAVVLTLAMFVTRERMLGFPCGIFWAVLAGMCYQASSVTWDIDYISFFACMGMFIFTIIAAFALKESPAYGDEEMEQGDGNYLDETPEKPVDDDFSLDSGRPPTKRTTELHKRAEKRKERYYGK